jgi:hypothetical protein
MTTPEQYMKASAAARYLGVARQRIYELAETRRLGTKIADYWVFTQAELDAYKREREQNKGGRPKRNPALPKSR